MNSTSTSTSSGIGRLSIPLTTAQAESFVFFWHIEDDFILIYDALCKISPEILAPVKDNRAISEEQRLRAITLQHEKHNYATARKEHQRSTKKAPKKHEKPRRMGSDRHFFPETDGHHRSSSMAKVPGQGNQTFFPASVHCAAKRQRSPLNRSWHWIYHLTLKTHLP